MRRSYRGKIPRIAVPFAILTVSLLLACFAFVTSRPVSAVPTTMNFQGRLADASGNIVPNGLYNMQFKLFTVNSGGSSVWNETRETTNRVQVTNGLFSTKLGEVTPISASLFASGNLYFEITLATPATATCSTASCASWESAMTPRHQMSTSAYAFNSDTLDGLDSTAFAAASGSANYIQNTTTPQTADFSITGIGTAGALQAATLDRANAGTLTIGGANATAITLSDNTTVNANLTISSGNSLTLAGGNTASRPGSPVEGMVYYDTDTKQLLTYANGKWQADRSDAILVAASNSSAADKAAADYIADGNTGTANDGDQVQINSALTAASGKKVVLLAGIYTVDASISVPNNTTLAGVGKSSIIELADLDADIDTIVNTDTSTGTGVVLRDFKFDGRNDLNTAGYQIGIYLSGVGSAASNRTGAVVTGVEFTRIRSGVMLLNAIQNSTISNNKVYSNPNDGLSMYGTSSFNKILGNTFSDGSGGFAISVSADKNTISSNSVRSYIYGYGIQVTGNENTISDNMLSGNYSGMQIQGNSIVITGNAILASLDRGAGIIYSTKVTFSGNIVDGSTTAGVELYNASQTTVSTNTITNNAQHGIQIGGASGNVSTGSVISGNVIQNSGSTGAFHSINVNTYAADTKVTDNKITDTAGSGYAISIAATGVSGTYLSNNVFSGTGATAINDASTSTIYANQSKTAGGLDVFFKQTASANAFQIQNASGAALLTADSNSTNNRIQIGSSTTDATAIFFMLDQYNNGTDPTGAVGAMYYNTSTNKFRCYQNTGWTDCIASGGGGAATDLNNLTSTNINAALNATSANLTLQTTTSGNIIINAAGTTELQDDTNVGGNLTIATSKYLKITGGITSTRPASPSDGMVYFDTTTKQLLTYTNGKWQSDGSDAIYVAASDSIQADKDAADYVADGNTGTAADGDQVQINNALNQAATSPGNKKVVLLAGTYTVDQTILMWGGVTLTGVSSPTTTIKLADLDATENVIENQGTDSEMIIKNITIDGQKSLNTAGTQHAISFFDAYRSTIENVYVTNMRNDAISLDTTQDITVQKSSFNSNTNDIEFRDTTTATIQNNRFGSPTGVLLQTGANDNLVIGNNFNSNSGYGVNIQSGSSDQFRNNLFNANSTAIYVAATASGHIINGNTVRASQTGIAVVSATDVTVSNNTIINNGTSTTNDAISLTGAARTKITDNNISDDACSVTCYAINIDATSSSTYLSNNTFISTPTTSTINDASSSTRYVSQSTAEQGLNMVYKQTASTTAFRIQNASSAALLTADSSSTNNRIQIGSSTTDATAIFFMLDQYNNGTDPTGANGAMYYNSNTNKFRCFENSAWADCVGANKTLSNLGTTAINTSLVSDTTNTDDLGSSGITWRSGYFGTSLSTPALRPAADGATAFKIQNAGGTVDYLTVDTTTTSLKVGTSDTTGTLLVLDTKTGAGDPSGIDGAMYYNSADKSFRCYKNGAWNDCNFRSLRSEWVLQEDFNTNTVTAGTGATLSNIGNENWTFVSIGTGGTLTRTNVGTDASNQDRFGVMQMNSPGTSGTGASVRLDNTGMAGVPSNMTVEFDLAPVNAAAAAGLQQTIRIGLLDSVTTAAPTDGIYFQYNTTTTAGNWFRCTQVTCVDTGVARTTTANTYQRFKIKTNAAGNAVEFFINEASVGTASTNLPGATASYGPTINVSTVDATIRQWKIDYFQIYRSLTTLR